MDRIAETQLSAEVITLTLRKIICILHQVLELRALTQWSEGHVWVRYVSPIRAHCFLQGGKHKRVTILEGGQQHISCRN
eukprot:452222-Pyramimonas_sp.AAC.2